MTVELAGKLIRALTDSVVKARLGSRVLYAAYGLCRFAAGVYYTPRLSQRLRARAAEHPVPSSSQNPFIFPVTDRPGGRRAQMLPLTIVALCAQDSAFQLLPAHIAARTIPALLRCPRPFSRRKGIELGDGRRRRHDPLLALRRDVVVFLRHRHRGAHLNICPESIPIVHGRNHPDIRGIVCM